MGQEPFQQSLKVDPVYPRVFGVPVSNVRFLLTPPTAPLHCSLPRPVEGHLPSGTNRPCPHIFARDIMAPSRDIRPYRENRLGPIVACTLCLGAASTPLQVEVNAVVGSVFSQGMDDPVEQVPDHHGFSTKSDRVSSPMGQQGALTLWFCSIPYKQTESSPQARNAQSSVRLPLGAHPD